MEWFEHNQDERIKEIYSKYNIEDFWNWWSDGNNEWMEIRTKGFEFSKEIGKHFKYPYSHTGVFVNSYLMLKNVIAYVRKHEQTIWFGIQPRKKNYKKYGRFKQFSGGDYFVDSIKFIFVDIDRKTKFNEATSAELGDCDKVVNKIIDRFSINNWNKSYIKICSGNGVQLMIKLDVPLKLPNVEGKSTSNGFSYSYSKSFELYKKILPEVVGKPMIKYLRPELNRLRLNAFIDETSFRLSNVGALPFTKNYKYGKFTWRGIIELKNEQNTGLSDYLIALSEDIKTVHNIFASKTKSLDSSKRFDVGHLKENKLIRFMLDNNLPAGQRNNYLWFQVKCLIRDYGIDVNSDEFKILHRQMTEKYGNLPMNIPDVKFHFDENIVNKYCFLNGFPPLYEVYPKRNKRINLVKFIKNTKIEDISLIDGFEIDPYKDIFEDLFDFSKILKTAKEKNILFCKFLKACIDKYGLERAKFYYMHLMDKILNYE